MKQFIHTTIQEDVIDSILKANKFSEEINKNPLSWKWIIISLHSGLQGLMVLALQEKALDDYCLEELRKAHSQRRKNISESKNSEIKYPERKLDTFEKLYKKIRKHRLNDSYVYDHAIKFLNKEIRDNFIHFSQDGWSIDVSSLLKTCREILPLIIELASNPSGYRWENDYSITKIINSIESIKQNFDKYEKYVSVYDNEINSDFVDDKILLEISKFI